jgi:hypothetical protein
VGRNSDLAEKRLFQPNPKISGRVGINRLSPFARDNNYKYYVLFHRLNTCIAVQHCITLQANSLVGTNFYTPVYLQTTNQSIFFILAIGTSGYIPGTFFYFCFWLLNTYRVLQNRVWQEYKDLWYLRVFIKH